MTSGSGGVPRIGVLRRALGRIFGSRPSPIKPASSAGRISTPLQFPSLIHVDNIGSLVKFNNNFQGKFVFYQNTRSLAVGTDNSGFERLAKMALGSESVPQAALIQLVSGTIIISPVSGPHNIDIRLEVNSGMAGTAKDTALVASFLQDILKENGYTLYNRAGASEVGAGVTSIKFINPSMLTAIETPRSSNHTAEEIQKELSYIWSAEFKALPKTERKQYIDKLKESLIRTRDEIRSSSLPESEKEKLLETIALQMGTVYDIARHQSL